MNVQYYAFSVWHDAGIYEMKISSKTQKNTYRLIQTETVSRVYR